MKGQHPRITLPIQPLCRSCGEPAGNINYGTGRAPAFCQRNAFSSFDRRREPDVRPAERVPGRKQVPAELDRRERNRPD